MRADEAPGAEALDAFPLVGIAVGCTAGSLAAAVARFAPRPLAVATAFGAPIALTGALHVDGFLDASDAFFASVPVERRFEILKDPHVGGFAVASFAVVGAYAIASLQAIDSRDYPFALAFAGGIARLAASANAYRHPYGRPTASARFFARRPSALWLAAAGALACAAGARTQRRAFASAATVVAAGSVLGAWCSRQLGGRLVGDAYGFMVVSLEPLALASCAAFARRCR